MATPASHTLTLHSLAKCFPKSCYIDGDYDRDFRDKIRKTHTRPTPALFFVMSSKSLGTEALRARKLHSIDFI